MPTFNVHFFILLYWNHFLLLWTSKQTNLQYKYLFHKLLKQSPPLQVVYKPWLINIPTPLSLSPLLFLFLLPLVDKLEKWSTSWRAASPSSSGCSQSRPHLSPLFSPSVSFFISCNASDSCFQAILAFLTNHVTSKSSISLSVLLWWKEEKTLLCLKQPG